MRERLEHKILTVGRQWAGDGEVVLVDAGCMGGLEPEWATMNGFVRFIGFEPDEREFQKLAATHGFQYFNAVLCSTRRPLKLFVSRDSGKTSIYRPNFAFLRRFPSVERFDTIACRDIAASEVRTLDEMLGPDAVEPDFLKIDTQGSELDILRGAQDTLRHAVGIKVEVSFVEIYEGQPLFPAVHECLARAGFELFGLDRVFWKRKAHTAYEGRGQLVFADALYLRTLDSYFDITLPLACRPLSKTIRAVAVAVLYGVHDYAVELLDEHAARLAGEAGPCDAVRTLITDADQVLGGWSESDHLIANRPNWT